MFISVVLYNYNAVKKHIVSNIYHTYLSKLQTICSISSKVEKSKPDFC